MMTEAEAKHNLALLVWERVVLPNEGTQLVIKVRAVVRG
jgi:hypothetical protein